MVAETAVADTQDVHSFATDGMSIRLTQSAGEPGSIGKIVRQTSLTDALGFEVARFSIPVLDLVLEEEAALLQSWIHASRLAYCLRA